MKHTRTWSETGDGWYLNEQWFGVETSTYRSRAFIIRKDGTLLRPQAELGYHANEIIRCYTIPEMQAMISRAGLQYLASYSADDLSVPPKPPAPDAIRNIVVAERSPEE
jgi:hypothetical protein